jgi:2-polyprenyl-6-methoxyphenol hydroxylase-like FAD-dependent oxidoreductase
MAGLAACGALSQVFDEVELLERDELADELQVRAHVPQGNHVHSLLAGGERALSELFPGFVEQLLAAGAVPVRGGIDMVDERPPVQMPSRDLGLTLYAMTRPCLERVVRGCARMSPNVTIRDRARVVKLECEAGRVSAVLWTGTGEETFRVEADLVVDTSGRARPTLELLRSLDVPLPDEEVVGVDLAYSSAVFELAPTAEARQWKGFLTQADPLAARTAGALLMPIEGGRHILSAAGRHGNYPPEDPEAFMEFLASSLPTKTIPRALAGAKLVGSIKRYRFPESRWFHFESLDEFPEGLLVLGDAFCRFNPVNGQGMSVAAQSALCLRDVLLERETLEGLAREMFERITDIAEGPWSTSTFADFLFSNTTGQRPSGFETFRRTRMALTYLTMEHADLHELQYHIFHLVEPRWALRSRILSDLTLRMKVVELMHREEALAAEAAQ